MLQNELARVLRKYKIESLPLPLYHCLPFGLRFEGGEDALARAEKVFAAAFPKNHTLLVIFDTPPEGKLGKALAGFESEHAPNEHYDTTTGDLWVSERYYYAMPTHALPHTLLFDTIIKDSDYAERVWLADCESGMLMMLYDGRGFDITSPDPGAMAALYKEFKAFLSLMDLPEMKQKFEF